ncbi:MAG: hypothetical protein ACREJJ_00180, partial [Candidatus Methylomirabilales bacterium]
MRASEKEEQHVQALSDIGGSGGVPRQATAWETEARSVPGFLEQGGTQAVSRRSGSPREPRSEGPKVLFEQNQQSSHRAVHGSGVSAQKGC